MRRNPLSRAASLVAASVRRFYSWHSILPLGTSRFGIVVPDSIAGAMVALVICQLGVIVLPGALGVSPFTLILGSLAFAIASPLFAWQVVIVSANGVAILRTFLILPYWLTRIPPGTDVELYEAWEDPAPSGVAYKVRNDYAFLGNSWNAQTLFELLRECERSVRPETSLERAREQ